MRETVDATDGVTWLEALRFFSGTRCVMRETRGGDGRGHVARGSEAAYALRVVRGVLVLLLVGCGGPGPATPRVVPVDAGMDAMAAAPDDPAMAEVLVWLEAQRAAMCACEDAACADETDALGFDWSFQHKALLDAARPSPAQDVAARALIEATETCNERWHHAPP